MSNLPGFNCQTCGKRHDFSMYVIAHASDLLRHRCDLCAAVHDILPRVEGLPERQVVLAIPGFIPKKTTSFELSQAAAEHEPTVTDWITSGPPERDGFYHIRFPNGTESDRNWFWRDSRFWYAVDSPVSIGFESVGGFRGLDRAYN